MEGVIFRKAVRADISSLLQLLHQLFAIEEDFTFQPDRQQRGLQLLLESQDGVIIVAEKDNEVIGMATGQKIISTAEGAPALLVEDVVVTSMWQRSGIGSALIKEVGFWGKEQGAERMQLLADKNNEPALCFYRENYWHKTALICLRKYNTDSHEYCTD